MAFEDGSPASSGGSRYLGEGFRQEPDFRDGTTTAPVVGQEEPEATISLTKRAAPNLEYVFDDPAEGEPGRDRMMVHGLWELLLALALAGTGYLLYRSNSSAFSGDQLRGLLLTATFVGLAASGAALTLRAGAANLAIGPVAVASALYFGEHAADGLAQPLLAVIGLTAAVGAVLAVAVVGLHVPGWAASLGAGLAVTIWSSRQQPVVLASGYNPLPHAYWWFGVFCALSALAGVVGLIPSLRRAFGRFRPVADPAHRRGAVAALIAFGAITVSTVLAGVAGVLTVSVSRAAVVSDGFDLTALALGAALLGGTSAFGRRGGIFGTVFAAALLVVASAYAQQTHRAWPPAAFAAVAIGLGLAVTRLVERFGRPTTGNPDGEADEDWMPRSHSGNGWTPAKPYAAPAQSAVGGLWASDDAWGSTERR